MPITCPQCHTRCRLKNDQTIPDSGLGTCPKCNHTFIIPPGTIQDERDGNDLAAGPKKAGLKPGFKIADMKNLSDWLASAGKKTGLWIFAGLGLALLLSTFFFWPKGVSGPESETRPEQEARIETKPALSRPTPEIPLKLATATKAKVIALIKHHALVGDADISVCGGQLQLALLVAGKTPATYAERLGRQFANYLQAQLAAVPQPSQPFPVAVSVYYPEGTRIEVTTTDQGGEEEVLPK
ncbi:MAG: hypothetical protein JXR80_02590 [Deltaproteobacteria bacterium]|nr:hypothetical protein [Deltaproteobacteria bacterium]